MATSRRQRFVRGQVAWMLAVLVVLSLFDALSLSLFLGTSLVGLLLTFEVTSPLNVEPEWRSRLRWLVVLGLVAFGVLVVVQAIEILPSGVL